MSSAGAHQPSGLPYAMVGGGIESGVGALHRDAAHCAGLRLVAGCFSRDAARNAAAGAALGLPSTQVFDSLDALMEGEAARPDGARLLVVCTPHVEHAGALRAAVGQGWRVVVEKPLCVSLEEAESIAVLTRARGETLPDVALPLVMRYLPGLRRLRAGLMAGEIGHLRWMSLEYLQGRERHARDDWRFRRHSAGPAGTLADLGPHAWDLCHWLSGEEPEVRAAEIRTLNPDHELEDSAWVWLELGNEARAQVTLCQAAVGLPSECRIRLFGTQGSREWRLSNEVALAGSIDGLYRLAFEAFYADVAQWHRTGAEARAEELPTWQEGVRAVRLTQGCLAPSTTAKTTGKSSIKLLYRNSVSE